jgi:hypothetical protein
LMLLGGRLVAVLCTAADPPCVMWPSESTGHRIWPSCRFRVVSVCEGGRLVGGVEECVYLELHVCVCGFDIAKCVSLPKETAL